MRQLHLLRHAEALPAAQGAEDRDRPLSEQGRAQARMAAERLRGSGALPDRVLASPARRTRETATIVCAALSLPEPRYEATLYPGSTRTLLKALRALEAGVQAVLLVGHNPAISELLDRLAGPGAGTTHQYVQGFSLPTAGLATLQIQTNDWAALGPESIEAVTLVPAPPRPPPTA